MTRRTRSRVVLTVLAVVAGLVLWSGCATDVRPPESVEDPVTVHLVATGRHSGLLLPRPGTEGAVGGARVVEYGYGDWGWYALCQDDWWRAPATALWPNCGTLGRREVSAASVSTAPGAYDGGTLRALVVPRRAAEDLLARLDGEFEAGGEPIFNRAYGLWFVRHPERFWMFHDCHDEVAEWLESLGCDVGWAPVRTGLEVAAPAK